MPPPEIFSDIVVLLPGIGGSVLRRDGDDVWAPSAGAALRGALSLGRSVSRLRLDGDDPEADDLGDGIHATRLLPDFHIVPGLDWKVDGYGEIGQRLKNEFRLEAGHNYFEFPYDWRRDNRVAARQLARAAPQWLAQWRQRSGNNDAKLVLVGHSMGGVIARIYLELFEGWRDTRRLVTFGTPYSGSVNALDFLANGFRKGWGPFTVDLSALLRSFTSVYQLLPSYRCFAVGTNWVPLDDPAVTLPNVDQQRLAAALALHRAVRQQVDLHRRSDYEGTGGYDIRAVVGDFQPTKWAAMLQDGAVRTLYARADSAESGGDGTVPKVSAQPHELLSKARNATFVSQRHASLQNDGAVLDHLAGVLRHVEYRDVFPAGNVAVALEVDDALLGEPLVVRAMPVEPQDRVAVTLRPRSAGPGRSVQLTRGTNGWYEAVVEGLQADDYEVQVSSAGLHPVTEVASVVDPATFDPAPFDPQPPDRDR